MTPTPDTFPQQFGPYVLIRLLGIGGMGDVYLALSGRLGMEKPCVVKRLAQHSTTEDGERFRREANLARKLSHGAIAQTLAVDEIDGELIIAQEFLHGCSLSTLLATCLRQRDQVPLRLAVHIAREVARALSYAHEQGVIHRDIAPDNVMLTFAGEVRLLDFGIARTASDPRLTRPGWSVGREAYAAPEIAAGASGDSRSDTYSLGVLLWQILARRPPPVKEALTPASMLNPEVTSGLDAIVARATAQDPAERFQRADQFLKVLGAHVPADFSGEMEIATFLQKHYDVARERELLAAELARGRAFLESRARSIRTFASPPAVAASRRRRRRVVAWVGGVAALLAIALAVAVRGRSPGRSDRRPVAVQAAPQPVSVPSNASPTLVAASSSAPRPPSPPAQPARTPSRRGAGSPERRRALDSAVLLADARERFDMGDIEGALQSARQAIRTGGGAPAHLLTGQVLAKMNHLRDAEREVGVAIRLDPSNAAAAEALRSVRERLRATSTAREEGIR